MENNVNTAQNWFFLGLLSLIWGSSFILMKKGLVVFSANQVAAMRIFFAFSSLLPFIFPYIKNVKRKDWLPIAGVALFGSGIPPFLFTAAQTELTSAAAGILNSLTPFFTLLIGILLFGVMLHWKKLLGVGLGFLGAILLIIYSAPEGVTNNYWYGIYVVLASICYGISVNIIKTYCQHIHPMTLNVSIFSLLGLPIIIYLFLVDANFVATFAIEGAWLACFYIFILALLGTSFASIIFFKLTQNTNALFASTVTYLSPIVAVLWGIGDGEAISWAYWVGMLLILMGVYVTSRK